MSTDEILKELNIRIANPEHDKKIIKKFNDNTEKVRYLRSVKHYKQKDIAKLVGISVRQVQRIESKIKKMSH